ncbi:unnamed protein product, partial [Strongylus vulgaris]
YNENETLYHVDCNAKAVLTLKIGKHDYPISSDNMVIRISEDICLLALFKFFALLSPFSWVLGDPFIREYCNIHDMGNEQIGFAKSLQGVR